MSPRFDEVARLNNLLGRREAIVDREKDTRTINHGIVERMEIDQDIRNAARWLTEVAGCFQKGDAHELDVMSTFFSIPREGMTTTSYQKWLQWALVLTRLQKAAEIMEEKE